MWYEITGNAVDGDINMTYEEAVQAIPCGRYRHFKGNEYEVIAIARHRETIERDGKKIKWEM